MRRIFAVAILAFAAACSTAVEPVDFATLTKSWKPNQYLLCPTGFCRAETPDAVAPEFPLPAARLAERARAALLAEPRTELIGQAGGKSQIVLVQRSAGVGFPDTVFVEFVPLGPERSSLAIYSRSNFGIGDRGVNAARVKTWLQAIEAASRP